MKQLTTPYKTHIRLDVEENEKKKIVLHLGHRKKMPLFSTLFQTCYAHPHVTTLNIADQITCHDNVCVRKIAHVSNLPNCGVRCQKCTDQ